MILVNCRFALLLGELWRGEVTEGEEFNAAAFRAAKVADLARAVFLSAPIDFVEPFYGRAVKRASVET